MSCYIVDRETVDIVVTASLEWSAIPIPVRPAAGAVIGRGLWAANLRAAKHRYPREADGNRPGPASFRDSDVDSYEWTERVADPADVRDAIESLGCQCADSPEWATDEIRPGLDALAASAEHRARELDRVTMLVRESVPHIDYDVKRTAAAMRKALRAAFPGVKFSVTMARGTAYGWLSVNYADGPTARAVGAITSTFESSRFDGQDDGYHRVEPTLYLIDGVPTEIRYSCCGANVSREFSDAANAWAAPIVAADPAMYERYPNTQDWERRYRLLAQTDLCGVDLGSVAR